MLRKILSSCLLIIFFLTYGLGADYHVWGQGVMVLPPPGIRLSLSPVFTPPLLKGIKVFRNDPFRFDFVLDQGVETLRATSLQNESLRLIKYFLAALTVPEKDLWVNLSPYEKDRIVPEAFGQTEMGRDLLAQDYILKQITASVIYPDEKTGKAFWAKVYAEAQKRYGTTDIPVDTFNKVWITPEKATVYEHQDAAFVTESKLKVMLESDYLAMENDHSSTGGHVASFANVSPSPLPSELALNAKAAQVTNRMPNAHETQDMAKDILRDVIIPILEQEVNAGQNFATLRQVYNSLILATWYKRKIKASIMGLAYVDQKKVSGLGYALPTREHIAPFANVSPSTLPNELALNVKATQVSTDLQANLNPEQIWTRYVEAFKKGAYNLIKEEYDPATQTMIPRKYFSGGTDLSMEVFTVTDAAMPTINNVMSRSVVVQFVGNLLSGSMVKEDRMWQTTDAEGSTNGSRDKTINEGIASANQAPHRLTTARTSDQDQVERVAIASNASVGLKSSEKVLNKLNSSIMIAIGGVSGAGKTTLMKYLLEKYPDYFTGLVETTTRPPRNDDLSGMFEYISESEFESREQAGDMFFVTTHYGYRYGYCRRNLENALITGKMLVCIMDEEVKLVRNLFPHAHVKRVLPASSWIADGEMI